MAETHYIGGWASGQGCYALAEVVGRGGFATVWRAHRVKGSRQGYFGRFGGNLEVAVKVIPVYSSQERSRALREGQIAEGLHHKNIVETLEVIPGDVEVYLVTEFVRGQPLDAAAQRYDLRKVTDALVQILEALSYAHSRGVIHRDIKPQNVLVDNWGKVKLTDFGAAYRAGDTRLTQIGYALGTPGYIAPEILDGQDPTELTDIYAVGATARALLSRQPDEPPPRLLEFVNRATSPNPAHRPQSAAAALRLLTGRRESTGVTRSAFKEREGSPVGRYAGQILRIVNGLVAGWLGYLGGGLLLDGAGALGVAAGFGVLGYLLPRLGAFGVIVALAVALIKSHQVGLGFATLLPTVGGLWVAASSASQSVRWLPLGPLLAIPLGAGGLGAGLPLFLGGIMRPLGAALSAAAGAFLLVVYDLAWGDGVVPYLGLALGNLPRTLGPMELLQRGEMLVQTYPALAVLAALWAAMAGVVSVAERFGVWALGLILAIGGGVLGYALAISFAPAAFSQAMTSLSFAAIIYGTIKYLESRFGG
ncbi:MAG: serine/threonine protein kinase [Actinomycetota bacterium]|nr:serine/threonine protein kinase [Actinomycetota bacterium]